MSSKKIVSPLKYPCSTAKCINTISLSSPNNDIGSYYVHPLINHYDWSKSFNDTRWHHNDKKYFNLSLKSNGFIIRGFQIFILINKWPRIYWILHDLAKQKVTTMTCTNFKCFTSLDSDLHKMSHKNQNRTFETFLKEYTEMEKKIIASL